MNALVRVVEGGLIGVAVWIVFRLAVVLWVAFTLRKSPWALFREATRK